LAVGSARRVLEVLPDGAPFELAAQVRARADGLGQQCADFARSNLPVEPPQKLGCGAKPPQVALPKGVKRLEVRVKFHVLIDGRTSEVTSDGSPHGKLLEAYVKSCAFRPAIQGGEPIETWMEEVFSLSR
jgi:hypothetical protein